MERSIRPNTPHILQSQCFAALTLILHPGYLLFVASYIGFLFLEAERAEIDGQNNFNKQVEEGKLVD